MCALLCAHISISLEGPLPGDSRQGVMGSLAPKPAIQSLIYHVTWGE